MKRTTEDIRENLSFVGCDNETALEMCEEIERLLTERDEARVVAANLYRFLSYHEAVPEIDEQYDWLIEAAGKCAESANAP